jgi:hypothetical protein
MQYNNSKSPVTWKILFLSVTTDANWFTSLGFHMWVGINTFGYDELPTKLLKISSCFVSPPLNCICNRSLRKVFKKVTHIRLDHLNNNNILVEGQFGFRVKLSTEKATHNLTHEILKALNNKLILGHIFCDCVNQDIILPKLKFYAITGKANALCKSYLKDRYQRVIMCNTELNHNTFRSWGKIKVVFHKVQFLVLCFSFFI